MSLSTSFYILSIFEPIRYIYILILNIIYKSQYLLNIHPSNYRLFTRHRQLHLFYNHFYKITIKFHIKQLKYLEIHRKKNIYRML